MVELAAAVVVERKGPIGGGLQVVAPDSAARIPLCIDGSEGPPGVLQNLDRARARPIQHEMVELAAAVVVERKGPISRGPQVVAPDSPARSPLCVDWSEGPPRVLRN